MRHLTAGTMLIGAILGLHPPGADELQAKSSGSPLIHITFPTLIQLLVSARFDRGRIQWLQPGVVSLTHVFGPVLLSPVLI